MKILLLLLGLSSIAIATDWQDGSASCFGNYVGVSSSPQACGTGNWIDGEDWTYSTAMCHNWNQVGQSTCNSCYEVKCVTGSAMTANMGCSSAITKVKVVDTLASSACSSGHVFDLNDVTYSAIATEGGATAGCSGHINVQYRPVSCDAVDLVSSGIKIGLLQNQVDPWCPPFFFSNVAGAGALHSVQVSVDGGTTWLSLQQVNTNGARWDCQGSQGTYLGNALSFKLETCALASLPQSCASSGEYLTLIDVLPSNWCANGATPCTQQTFQSSQNFGTASGTTGGTTNAPTTFAPTNVGDTYAPTTSTGDNQGSSNQTSILLAFFLTVLIVVFVIVAIAGWCVWRERKAEQQGSLAQSPAESGAVVINHEL